MKGTHVYGSLYGCDTSLICSRERMSDLVMDAVTAGKMTMLGIIVHDFPPTSGHTVGGVSVTAIVGESHLTIHSWGEYNYLTVDIFTCGDSADPEAAFDFIASKVAHESKKKHTLDRSL